MHTTFQQPIHLLRKYLRPLVLRVALLTALLFSGIAFQLIAPQIIRGFIDAATAGVSQSTLIQAGLLFLAVAFLQQMTITTAGFVSEDIGWRATNKLRADLTEHCLRLDMPFHNAHTPGELIERVDGDVSTLANFFSELVIKVAGGALLAAGIIALLFREDFRAGLVGVGYVLLLYLFLRSIQPYSVRLADEYRDAVARLMGFLEESLVNTEDVRGNGAVEYVMGRFYRLMRRFANKERGYRTLAAAIFSGGQTIYALSLASILAIGMIRFREGALTIGTVFLLVYYVQKLETPLNEIRRQFTHLHFAVASVNRINAFLHLRPSVKENIRSVLPAGPLAVSFEEVSFRYKAKVVINPQDSAGLQPATLDEITFQLNPSGTLGLLGRTGSGKTTLTRLLFRLYDPDEGNIRLGGEDLRDLALSNIRERVGMVTQNVQLFAASLRENLTFFDRTISDQVILDALKELGLENWLSERPQGLDSPISAGGKGISAGEAQLIAFARVYLKDPGLIILDEASSRLDPSTEKQLDRAIHRLLENRTAIIIAHRLATVQRVDRIMILDSGRIVEAGNREALSRDPDSHFSHLLRTGLEDLQTWEGENSPVVVPLTKGGTQ